MFIDKELYNEIYNILRTDFKTYECINYMYINQEDMYGMLQEFIYAIDYLKEEYNQLEKEFDDLWWRRR